MQAQIAKWGNSLGLRLPKALAEHIGAREGQKLTIVADGARLIIEPVAQRPRLAALSANMKPEAMRAAFDCGEDAGRKDADK